MPSKAQVWIERVLLPGLREIYDQNSRKAADKDPVQRMLGEINKGVYQTLITHIESSRSLWQEPDIADVLEATIATTANDQ